MLVGTGGLSLKLLLNFMKHFSKLRGARVQLLEGLDLLCDVVRVFRKFLQEARDLPGDDPAEAAQHQRSHQDDYHHRRDAREAEPFKRAYRHIQQEREEDCEGDRDEHHADEIQGDKDHDGDHGAGQKNERLLPRRHR